MGAKIQTGFHWDEIPSLANPANPAAGADFTYTIPTDFRGFLQGITAELTTNATVANRATYFNASLNAHTLHRWPSTGTFANQTAGRTNSYEIAVGLISSDAADQVDRAGTMPDYFELKAGTVVEFVTTLKQATDQWLINWNLKLVPT